MTDSGGISRRKALQRIGVGAVAVWSAPMVTSVASAAPVGSPPPGPRCTSVADCPQPTAQCQVATCVNGVCGTGPAPNFTLCSGPFGGTGLCNNGVCLF